MDRQHYRPVLRIAIGSAWLDSHLQPEEISYLHKLLQRYGLEHDRELLELIQTPVAPATTEAWLADYLRDINETERMQLLANVGNLLIADGQVSLIEHDLLDDFYTLMAQIPPQPEPAPPLVATVGKYVRRVLQQVTKLVS
uniref:Co-chaperone DjlA N-terminal domain-containing protein n=1 Tax=Cyanothece sp. (strain PCC 7425 / ATCC 29141) TaxID=395961 RepID=B8HWD8_CYAP4